MIFLPLYLFDLHDSIEESILAFFKGHADVPDPVFDGHSTYLLVFDGLDELVMQGQNGPKIAAQFLASLDKMLQRARRGTLLAVVSGREVLLDAIAGLMKRHRILKLMPFYIDPALPLDDPWELRTVDQRHVWWRRYGALKGRDYDGVPAPLQRAELVDISSQPLLNYILALSYERGRIDFTATPTINTIYHDVIAAVFDRGWGGRHPSTGGIVDVRQFIVVLQEIALAAWQGNGRTTTVAAALERCRKGKVEHLLDDFSAGAQQGLTQLLTAFYFRYRDERIGSDRTFEFTHKSFSEYLLAARIVFVAATIANDEKVETNVEEHLSKWLDVSGVPYDVHVFTFVWNEIRLLPLKSRDAIRKNLVVLLRRAIELNMPLSHGSLRDNLAAARRCGTALLAVIAAAGETDKERVRIDLPTVDDFGQWLTLMIGSRADSVGTIVLQSLQYLVLDGIRLQGEDVAGAVFRASRVAGSQWARSNLTSADFREADVSSSKFDDCHGRESNFAFSNLTASTVHQGDWSLASFSGTRLSNATFSSVGLRQSAFDGASAGGTVFFGSDLTHCTFDGADLRSAIFRRCRIHGASFRGANLTRAVFEGCTGIESLDFKDATLIDASFPETDLKKLDFSEEQREQLRRKRDAREELDVKRR